MPLNMWPARQTARLDRRAGFWPAVRLPAKGLHPMRTAEKTLMLQTIGRFISDRIFSHVGKLQADIDRLHKEVAELKSWRANAETRGLAYRGVYQKADTYERGDVVTFQGSMWVAIADVGPNEGPSKSDSWVLAVKHGQDGKPGRDGYPAVGVTP